MLIYHSKALQKDIFNLINENRMETSYVHIILALYVLFFIFIKNRFRLLSPQPSTSPQVPLTPPLARGSITSPFHLQKVARLLNRMKRVSRAVERCRTLLSPLTGVPQIHQANSFNIHLANLVQIHGSPVFVLCEFESL